MIPFVCGRGGGRVAGRAWTTAAAARVHLLHTDVPFSRDATSIRSQWGLKQEEQLCDSLLRPHAHVPLRGHEPPISPPHLSFSLPRPPIAPLVTENHDEAALTWNNAKALNLHNANIWDIGLSAHFFFPITMRICRSSQWRQCFVLISATVSSQLLLLKLLPCRYCRWKAIQTHTRTENFWLDVRGSRSFTSLLSASSVTKGCREHPSALTFA